MKWFGAFVAGVILGTLAALVLLYFNPLSAARTAIADSTEVLSYELGPASLSITHGDQLGLDLQPADVPVLWEGTINRTLLGTFVLRDQQGNAVGIASRTVKLSPQSNVLLAGIMTAEHWLVTIPGQGSYFIDSLENIWPLLRATVFDVNLLGRSWAGTRHFELSAGPLDSGAARVIGTSGRFSGMTGTALHAIDIADYARASQLQYPVAGQLRLDFARPSQQAATPSATPAATTP